MHIVVTGSGGTIGTRLCEQLLAEGHAVQGIDVRPNQWKPEVDAVTKVGDLRDPAAMDQLDPTGVDAVVHLAANARVYDLVEDPSKALDNFITLFNALEWTRKHKIKTFVFASSRESYGNIKVQNYTEDLVRVENCESPYTASKVGGEALVHSYRQCYDMETIIVRFSNVYGAYDGSNRVVPLFIRRAQKNEPLTIFGKEKCLDFTYIDDAVRGVILILEQHEKVNGETFNLAFGEGTTIVRLADLVKELLGSSSPIDLQESRTGEVTHYVADITKAKTLLGYAPKTGFEEGVRKAVEWYKANT